MSASRSTVGIDTGRRSSVSTVISGGYRPDMLDLVAVAAQVRRMTDGLASLAQETAPRLAQALAAWESAASMGPALADRVRAAKTSWLVAEPLERLGAYDIAPVDRYRVVASD